MKTAILAVILGFSVSGCALTEEIKETPEYQQCKAVFEQARDDCKALIEAGK